MSVWQISYGLCFSGCWDNILPSFAYLLVCTLSGMRALLCYVVVFQSLQKWGTPPIVGRGHLGCEFRLLRVRLGFKNIPYFLNRNDRRARVLESRRTPGHWVPYGEGFGVARSPMRDGQWGAPEQVRISASPQGPQPVSQSFRRSLSDDSLRRELTSCGWLEPSSWLICFLCDRAPGNHQATSGGTPFLPLTKTLFLGKSYLHKRSRILCEINCTWEFLSFSFYFLLPEMPLLSAY